MRLSAIIDAPSRSSDYLERYVNDGSPSGFSLSNQLSDATDPLGSKPYFHPLVPVDESSVHVEAFRSRFLGDPAPDIGFVFHPDMLDKATDAGFQLRQGDHLRLVPTSSGRTARLLEPRLPAYLKMSFSGVLGRIERSIPRHKAIAGVEISDEILELSNSASGAIFGILPEVSARVACPADRADVEWGLVIRNFDSFPSPDPGVAIRVPLFSLWSRDRLAPNDPTLLEQIAAENFARAYSLALAVCSSAIRTFVDLFTRCGLLYEMNAQNILVECTANGEFSRLVLRDFNSTEKDLDARRSLGLSMVFASGHYKVISSQMEELYYVRHSFSFDFKLSTYVVEPIIKAILSIERGAGEELLRAVRSVADEEIRRLPCDFFPRDGAWYLHPVIDLVRERPYIKRFDPYLREIQ
jgi:hypothetical protein